MASVQMRMRLPDALEEYRDDLRRFLRAAEAKRARLVIFPELAGLMVGPPLLRDRGSALRMRASRGKRSSAGVWDRLGGKFAGWMADALKADLRRATAALLDVSAPAVFANYTDLFGGLARSFGVTLVAPSAWLPDENGRILNQTLVFGPTGDILGRQAKVLGYSEDEDVAARGRTWEVIPTEAGRLGIMLGSDVIYPEVGRVLAYQGAEVLIVQGACPSPAFYHKVRSGILARMQDNQLFAAASFLVGENPLRRGEQPLYQGKSALFAPQELTPRFNGVLVEMGGMQSEGVLTAEWDFTALRRLWDSSDTPIRRQLPAAEVSALLASLYIQLRALPTPSASELLGVSDDAAALAYLEADADAESGNGSAPGARANHAQAELHDMDELPLLGSVTSHWPLSADEAAPERLDEDLVELPNKRSYVATTSTVTIRRDDETDEMDAVEGETTVPEAKTAQAAAADDTPSTDPD